jgi:arylsulfatase
MLGAQVMTAKSLETFKDFPPRQRAARFTIDQAVEKMTKGLGSD